MVYQLEWLLHHRVLLVSYEDNLTVADMHQVLADIHDKLSGANRTVHIVVDMPAGHHFPVSITRLLPLAQQYYQIPNLGHSVLISDNKRFWVLTKMLSTLCNKQHSLVALGDTSTALDYLRDKDNSLKMTVTFQDLKSDLYMTSP